MKVAGNLWEIKFGGLVVYLCNRQIKNLLIFLTCILMHTVNKEKYVCSIMIHYVNEIQWS